MVNNAEIGTVKDGDDNKTVKKLSLTFTNSNKAAGYLNFKVKLAFTTLKKAFSKGLIFQHFDLKCHI